MPGLNVGDVHGRQSFGGQQGIDRVEVGVQFARIGDHVRKIRREVVGAIVAHGWIGLDFVHGQRLDHVHAEGGEIGDLADNVEERGGDARLGDRVDADVELVHDHVAEVWCDETGIVPRVGVTGANDAAAVREGVVFGQFSGVGVALEALGATGGSVYPEMI